MSHVANKFEMIARRTTQVVVILRSQGVQQSQALKFVATRMGQGFAGGLLCQASRKGSDHLLQSFSRIPSRKAVVVTMWDLIRGSLNSILVFLLVLLLGSNVVAAVNDAVVVDNQSQGNGANSMTWPLLPGESLNDVARLFYPKNKAMQQRFVHKTLRLSAAILPNLDPVERFETPVSLIIPTLKSLSVKTHLIKSGRKKSDNQKLKMSYGIEQIPAKLMQDYEILLSKNAFLKDELARLNEKLILLQAKLNELKLALEKTLSQPAQKVFKNLDHPATDKPQAAAAEKPATNPLFDSVSGDLIKMMLALVLLAGLSAYLLKNTGSIWLQK